jgi:hypothetical protein
MRCLTTTLNPKHQVGSLPNSLPDHQRMGKPDGLSYHPATIKQEHGGFQPGQGQGQQGGGAGGGGLEWPGDPQDANGCANGGA